MTISYSLKAENGILRVVAKGKDESKKDVLKYGLAVVKAAITNRTRRVFCDERELEYEIGVFDTFDTAIAVTAKSLGVEKVAIVCSPKNLESAHFWETVAVNRGLPVQFFTDIKKAEEWLDIRKEFNQ